MAEPLEEVAMEAAPSPSPDPVLLELYGSQRPPVELLSNVPLSPIVNSCWLPGDAKARIRMLHMSTRV